MKQSRAMSLVESIVNVIVGYGVAVATQILIFPTFGLHVTLAQNLKISAAFTLLCGAPHNTVNAERMIMQSLWRPSWAPQGLLAVVTPHNSCRCWPRSTLPSACPAP